MNDLFQSRLSFSWLIASLFSLLLICNKVELHSQPRTVVLFANWKDKSCGVAEHSRCFAHALKEQGINVVELDSVASFKNSSTLEQVILQVKEANPIAVNIQYSPWLYRKMDPHINHFMRILKNDFNIPTAISCHIEREGMEERLNEAELFIYYFKPKSVNLDNNSKSVYIPLPAPIFESSLSKVKRKKKYGYHANDRVISTCGFSCPHKRIPEVISLLAPFMKGDSKIKLQLLVSPLQAFVAVTSAELDRIRDVIVCNGLEDQVYLSGKYLEIDEYLERLSLSSLGFSWCPPDLHDSSAIEKDFVAVRVPLVVNDVSHNKLKAGEGVIRVNGELDAFTSEIISLSLDRDKRRMLTKEMQQSYSKINYGSAAKLHLKYFRKMAKH